MGFAQDITKFVEKTKLKGTTVLRKVAFDALRGVVMKTPVDTGRCRSSWRVGINRTDLTTEPDAPHKKAGGKAKKVAANSAGATQKAIADGNAKIGEAKWTDSIHITNNLPYAPALERGHSKQAPNGMLRLTFESIKATIRRMVS